MASTAVLQAKALFAEQRADEGWAIVGRLQQAGYAHPDFVALFPARAPSPFIRIVVKPTVVRESTASKRIEQCLIQIIPAASSISA